MAKPDVTILAQPMGAICDGHHLTRIDQTMDIPDKSSEQPHDIIEPTTGAKVDLVPLPRDPFTRAAFQRRQRMIYDQAGHSASFITPEDIV